MVIVDASNLGRARKEEEHELKETKAQRSIKRVKSLKEENKGLSVCDLRFPNCFTTNLCKTKSHFQNPSPICFRPHPPKMKFEI